jgi:hypothetical protein
LVIACSPNTCSILFSVFKTIRRGVSLLPSLPPVLLPSFPTWYNLEQLNIAIGRGKAEGRGKMKRAVEAKKKG